MSQAGFSGSAKTAAEFKSLLAQMLKLTATAVKPRAASLCNDGGMSWKPVRHDGSMSMSGGGSVSLRCSAYEGEHQAIRGLLQPLADWANAQGGTIEGTVYSKVSWNQTQYNPKLPQLPWMEKHPDREISTALLASMSKYFPAHYIATDAGTYEYIYVCVLVLI